VKYLEATEFTWIPEDMEDLKETIKAAIKERNKVQVLELASKIFNVFVGNSLPLYQLEATFEGGCYKSKADINAISLKPLSYDFDLNDAAEYDEDNITALESLEEYSVNHATRTASTRAKIWRFLNKFNAKIADPILRNINWAIQPTLLIQQDDEIWHPAVGAEASQFTRFHQGTITLMPTSWTAELVAPAYKKFVAVIEMDGKKVDADNEINSGLLGQIVDGSVKEIPLQIEAGHVYKIQYTAIDYSGRIKNLYYNIRGTK
jgi:hypothetical protein